MRCSTCLKYHEITFIIPARSFTSTFRGLFWAFRVNCPRDLLSRAAAVIYDAISALTSAFNFNYELRSPFRIRISFRKSKITNFYCFVSDFALRGKLRLRIRQAGVIYAATQFPSRAPVPRLAFLLPSGLTPHDTDHRDGCASCAERWSRHATRSSKALSEHRAFENKHVLSRREW